MSILELNAPKGAGASALAYEAVKEKGGREKRGDPNHRVDWVTAGKRIRKARRDQNLTQSELAELAGISPAFLGHIERGNRRPAMDTLLSLSVALNLSIDYVVGLALKPEPK